MAQDLHREKNKAEHPTSRPRHEMALSKPARRPHGCPHGCPRLTVDVFRTRARRRPRAHRRAHVLPVQDRVSRRKALAHGSCLRPSPSVRTLGSRSMECDIVVQGGLLSRVHAVIHGTLLPGDAAPTFMLEVWPCGMRQFGPSSCRPTHPRPGRIAPRMACGSAVRA